MSRNRSEHRRNRIQHRYENLLYLFNVPSLDTDDSIDSEISFSSCEFSDNLSVSSSSPSEPYSSDESDSFDQFDSAGINPDKSIYSEVLFSTLLSQVGLNLTACDIIVNLVNCFNSRFSKDPILFPSIRYFWESKAHEINVKVFILCQFNHAHGPFSGEPKFFPPYECETTLQPAKLQNGNYFLHIPLRHQLENILPILNYSCWFDNESIPDISNSIQAKKVKESVDRESGTKRLTLTIHADEISVGKSSTEKIFPVFISINELKKEYRRKFFFLVGLFIGKQKPHVECFLGPICEELKDLSINPVDWTTELSENFSATFHLIALIADAPMRAYLRNVKQFNHTFGCDWCRLEASTFNGARMFPYHSQEQLERLKRKQGDFLEFQRFYKENTSLNLDFNNRFQGFNGVTPLLMLADFDMVLGTAVEPMHSISLGVFRNLIMKGFLQSQENIFENRIDRNIFKREFSQRLISISVPTEFTRTPRSLDVIKYWKSNEIDSLLCYFFYLTAKGLLKPKIIHHVLTLSRLYYLAHVSTESSSKVMEISNMVEEFQKGCLEIYGEGFMSYNCHILSHLADSVFHLGPNSNVTSYPLEDYMGQLKLKVHRYSNIGSSLVRFFMADFKYREYKIKMLNKWNLTFKERKYFKIQDEKSKTTTVPDKKPQGSRENDHRSVLNLMMEKNRCWNRSSFQNLNYLRSIKLNGKRYSTSAYCAERKRDDSQIKDIDGKFYNIQYIVEYNSKVFFFCHEYSTKIVQIKFTGCNGFFSFPLENIHEIIKKIETLSMVETDKIHSKVIHVESSSFHFKYTKDHLVEQFLLNK